MGFGGTSGGTGSIQTSSDVALSGLSNNDVLTYNTADSKWENKSMASNGAPGMVALDSFTGANDDAKLAAAMTYCKGLTNPPYIQLGARTYNFSQPITPYDNFRLIGCSYGRVSYNNSPCIAKVNCGNQTWLQISADVHNMQINSIYFWNTDNQTNWLKGTGTLRYCGFHELSFGGFRSVIGGVGSRQLLLECSFTGIWSVASFAETAITIGGSDNMTMWPDGLGIYSNVISNNSPQLVLDTMSKSRMGPMYLSAQTGERGVLIHNSNAIEIFGGVLEGLGQTSPCDGSLLRIEGSTVYFHGMAVGDGMANPSATASANSNGLADRALIDIYGASQVSIYSPNFYQAAGVSLMSPCIYASDTSEVYVYGVLRHSEYGGPTWGGALPVVYQSSAGLIKASDASVQVTGP